MTGSSVKSNSLFGAGPGAGPGAGACALSGVMRVISGLAAGAFYRSLGYPMISSGGTICGLRFSRETEQVRNNFSEIFP